MKIIALPPSISKKKHWGSVDRKGVKGNHNMKIVKGASRL